MYSDAPNCLQISKSFCDPDEFKCVSEDLIVFVFKSNSEIKYSIKFKFKSISLFHFLFKIDSIVGQYFLKNGALL